MVKAPYLCLLFLLAALVIIQVIQGIEFKIINESGGTRGSIIFEKKLKKGANETMRLATGYVWKQFGQSESSDDRVKVVKINLVLALMQEDSKYELMDQVGRISISTYSIAKSKDAYEMSSNFINMLYYEMTHILQWNARGNTPKAIKDGIAAFIVLHSGDGHPPGWVERGGGNAWNDSPNVTGRFFEYVTDHLCPNFVPRLNAMMKDSYDDNYFATLTRMTIMEAWKRYKEKYKGYA